MEGRKGKELYPEASIIGYIHMIIDASGYSSLPFRTLFSIHPSLLRTHGISYVMSAKQRRVN